MDKHIHLHLYTGASKNAPAVKVEEPVQHDCGCGSSRDKHLGFKKLEGKLSHEKGVTDPAALAAKIGMNKLGKKAFEAKAAAGKSK